MHGVKKLALKKLEREILILFIGSPLVAAAFSSFGTRPNGSCASHDGGGSDPTGSVTHGASKGGVLYKGDVKKKQLSFRKERSIFLTSSSRPRLESEHARILVVSAGTFRTLLLVPNRRTLWHFKAA